MPQRTSSKPRPTSDVSVHTVTTRASEKGDSRMQLTTYLLFAGTCKDGQASGAEALSHRGEPRGQGRHFILPQRIQAPAPQGQEQSP